MGARKETPTPRILMGFLNEWKKKNGLTSDVIADDMLVSSTTVRLSFTKRAGQWNLNKLQDFCDAIGAPFDEALKAVYEEMTWRKK